MRLLWVMLNGFVDETLPCNLGSALEVCLFHTHCELGGVSDAGRIHTDDLTAVCCPHNPVGLAALLHVSAPCRAEV